MLLDARNSQEVPDFVHAPIVIIGAGTVGLFLAVSLVRAKIPIILVETGSRVANRSRSEKTAVSLGKAQIGLALGRAFGLGGTSTLWGGQLAEFDQFDLTGSERVWPIEYSELQRLYEHVYDFFNMKSREPVTNYRQRFGNEAEADSDIERFFTCWLPQPNFAALFRTDITSNPLLKVILNATANDILFEASKATIVCVSAPGGRKIQISGQKFVFASGTVEISRFFLSTQRRSNVPWKNNKHVGAYFMDHLGGKIGDVRIIDERKFRAYFENCFVSGVKLTPKLRFSSRVRSATSSGACGMFVFHSKLQENIDNLKFFIRAFRSGTTFSKLRTLPIDLWSLGSALLPLAVRYVCDRRVLAFFDRALDFYVQAEQIPTVDSAIRLIDEELQPDGLFRAGVNWKIDGAEIANIRDFACRASTYLRQKNIASIEIDERLMRRDGSMVAQFLDTGHQCGGMCMSASASYGIVDPDCRVWGTSNVYVAGASVFPTSSHANCTLTALALTGRLASFLRELYCK
jgi:choline dehydrogenase-like flavoprotein